MNKLTCIFCFILISLASCVEDVDLRVNGGESKIFFYSEFEVNQANSFRLKTATGINDFSPVISPTSTNEIEVNITEDNISIEPAYRYNPSTKNFECPINSFVPKEGEFYSISSRILEAPELPAIHSEIYIPPAKNFDILEVVKLTQVGAEQGVSLDLDFRFSIDTDHDYYEITAFAKNNSTSIDYPLEIFQDSYQDGVSKMKHRNSLFVDSKMNKGQYVYGKLKDYLSENIVFSSEYIYFKIKTISFEHYSYHKNLAKRVESANAAITEPVIAYTNINNGLGLFSGYSSIVDSLSYRK